MEISVRYNKEILSLRKLTDIIAFSIIFFVDNFKIIFLKVIFPQLFSILISLFLFISLDGEFNLTFLISKEGKIWIGLNVFLIELNIFNSIYQAIKTVCFQSLHLRNLKIKFKIFAFTTIRFILLLALIISYFYNDLFIINLFVFMFLNSYFYFYLFNQANRLIDDKKMYRTTSEKLRLHLNAFVLIILNRLLIISIPIIVTFSIFIVYEFMRILKTGKIFFYMFDRLDELTLLIIVPLLIYLLLNSFQYFSLMTFHKYFYSNTNQKFN